MSDVIRLFLKTPLFFLFCLLMLFEDTIFNSLGGALTSNAAFFLMPLVFSVELVVLRKRWSADFLRVCFGVTLFSLVIMAFFYSYELVFLLNRGGRQLILFFVFIFVFFYCKSIGLEKLSAGAKILFLVSFFALITNFLFPAYLSSQSIFHSAEYISSARLRGFSSEASNFGFQIVVCTLLLGVINRKYDFIFFILAIIFSFLSSSKGSLITLILAFSLVFLSGRISVKVLCVFFLVLFGGGFLLINYVLPTIYMDMEEYTSIATRSTMILVAIYSMYSHPVGGGFFGYLPVIYEAGPKIVQFLSSVFPIPLNFSEVNDYFVVGAFDSVGTKSLVFDLVITFGWLFAIPFFYFVFKVTRAFVKAKEKMCAILFVFVVISLSTYISNYSCYLIPYVFSFFVLKYKSIIGDID